MFSFEQDFSHGYPDIGLVSVGVGWCWGIALLLILDWPKVKKYNTALAWVCTRVPLVGYIGYKLILVIPWHWHQKL
jgi:hypothetical protein